jgi:hypothetical protein
MRSSRVGTTLALACAAAAAPVQAQAAPSAKICSLLPVAELETLFGAKGTTPKGTDAPTMSLCAANFPGVRRAAAINSMPPSPTDKTVTAQQRIDMLKQGAVKEGEKFESEVSGEVGCFRIEQDIGDKPLPLTTCFQTTGGYLSLAIGSDDPSHVSFKAVKDILAVAAKRRK